MRRRREKAFVSTACFLLAALLLVLTLFMQIRLRALESETASLRREQTELKAEERILSVRLSARTSLAEIERRACGELGMRPCRGDQIVEIVIEEDDAE